MGTSTNRWIYRAVAMGVLLLIAAAPFVGGQDSPAKSAEGNKSDQRIQKLEQRLTETEKSLTVLLKAFKELQAQQQARAEGSE